jgi:hypothetical protein
MSKKLNLRDTALHLLANRPVSLGMKTISEDVGISESWLRTFEAGKIDNPGVVTIENLIDYLRKYNAKVAC